MGRGEERSGHLDNSLIFPFTKSRVEYQICRLLIAVFLWTK